VRRTRENDYATRRDGHQPLTLDGEASGELCTLSRQAGAASALALSRNDPVRMIA
jgi:hypothetical protein